MTGAVVRLKRDLRLGDTVPVLAHGLRGFAGRLRWHAHFLQKLEDEPAIGWRHISRTTDGLRLGDGTDLPAARRDRLQAWCEGATGCPMVDACMGQLCAPGWLNFRMRAMLVSYAAYHLGLHRHAPGLFLARQFLDFEPGIHWRQVQMQSGTTGSNTLRICSAAKQARDHDPQGLSILRWLPEFGTAACPAPIVDEPDVEAAARQRLHALRQTRGAQDEARAIQQRHGSRRSGLPPNGGPSPPGRPEARTMRLIGPGWRPARPLRGPGVCLEAPPPASATEFTVNGNLVPP